MTQNHQPTFVNRQPETRAAPATTVRNIMPNPMKRLMNPLPVLLLLFAVLAIPQRASAALGSKQWDIILDSTSTTVTPGVASSVSPNVTVKEGSALGAATNGVTLTVVVAPSGAGVTATLASNGPFTGVLSTTVLTITNTAAAANGAYTVTVTGASTFAGSSEFTAGDINVFTYNVGALSLGRVWTPAGANLNWSTGGNWTPNTSPGSNNDVFFFDTGATNTVGVVDNIVDTSLAIGSLTYGQTNNFHTTQIASGKTLTVGGNANGLNAGTGTAAGDGLQTVNTITGAGATLVVSNVSASVNVDQSQPQSGTGNSSTMATLDLSGLDTFKANISRLLVGVDTSQALRGASGVLSLAKTNVITMTPGSPSPQISIGDNTQSGASPGLPSFLLLGKTNLFFADSIAVGRGKSFSGGGSSMQFNGSFVNPSAVFRGTNGNSSRVGTWTIGDASGAKMVAQNFGTNDFTGGTVNALVDQMFVGRGANSAILAGANVPGNGTLIFNAGTFDINTLEIGFAQTAAGNGAVNVNGGTLLVNTTLELAHGAASTGSLNVFNATVTANAGVLAGGGGANLVLNGATLNVTNAGANIGTVGSPFTSLAITNSVLNLALSGVAPVSTVTNLACDGANSINVTAVPLIQSVPAQFPLIQYSASAGNLGSFTLGTLPPSATPYVAFISNNTANSSIDLVITSGPIFYPLIWEGASSGDWDINTTANWKTNGVLTTYQQGYPIVQFDDTLTGTSSVNLTTILTPGSVVVNNSLSNFTFGGTGKISGAASLIKSGSGTLVLAESGGNDFSGGVTVNGGTIQVGNGGANGNLGTGSVALGTNASLVLDRSDNLTAGNVISGIGTLTKTGGNLLTLGGSNVSFSGNIVIAQGTLRANNPAGLGTAIASVTIANGATLDVNAQKFNSPEAITVSGIGVAGAGAIVNNATNAVTQALRIVSLTGNTTFGGLNDWDIHSSGNATSDAMLNTSDNTNKLTKVSTNTVTLFGVTMDGNLGDIDIQGGTLSVERNTTGLGNPTNTITVFTNATLQFQNASNTWSKNIVLNDGGTFKCAGSAEFAGPVRLTGGIGTFSAGTGTTFLLDAAIGGPGGLTKIGSGSLTLASAGTYTGPTLLTGGTLVLTGAGSIESSTSLTLNAGTTLDLSALADPTETLTGGQSLKGSGTIIGNVTLAGGSTLAPSGPGSNTLGTLTITNNLILQPGSTCLMEVSKVGGIAASDQAAATNVTYGGTLTVTCAGGALAPGDTFKLFAAGSYTNSFNAINLPAGVTWDTTQLGVNGTIQVVSVAAARFTSFTSTNGSFNLAFSGPAGNNYRILASTNAVARPVATTWTVVASNVTFNANGNATFVDTGSTTNSPARFYLISVP